MRGETACRRFVKHHVHTFAGGFNESRILNVALNPLDAELLQPFVTFSADYPDLETVIEQLLNDVQAEKSAAAGHQCVHNDSAKRL